MKTALHSIYLRSQTLSYMYTQFGRGTFLLTLGVYQFSSEDIGDVEKHDLGS
jgi:hypothetical protein